MKYTHSMIMLTGFTMKASDMKYYAQYVNKFLPKMLKLIIFILNHLQERLLVMMVRNIERGSII